MELDWLRTFLDPHPDVHRRFLDDGVAPAVLPAFAVRADPALRERILWHEPVCAVVPAAHRFADLPGPVGPADLVREPLVVSGASAGGVPDLLELLARRGLREGIELLKKHEGQFVSTAVEVDPHAEPAGVYKKVGAGGTVTRPYEVTAEIARAERWDTTAEAFDLLRR